MMTNRYGFILLFALCCLLACATSASADCAWVLWSRIKCWAKIHGYTGISEEGSLVDWFDWMRGSGRYDAQMRGKNFLHLKEHELYIVATEFGAMGFTGKNGTEWSCLPDTVDPRGPKGGAR